MTTEIAIMNKSAVALAADSALTISLTGPQGKSHKILNSANKLFALSKSAPIGLMVYGNAGLLGVPWETIVKMYREQLRNKEFDTLTDYCKDYFKFLDGLDIGLDLQEMYVVDVASAWCDRVRRQLDEWVEQQTQVRKKAVSESDVSFALRGFIKTSYDALKAGTGAAHSKSKRASLRTKYRTAVKGVVEEVFEKLPITQHMHSQLLTVAINAASIGPTNQSGIVIAGFGTKDLYPQCYDYDVAAVFGGKAIKKDKRAQQISNNNSAVIMPFAQSDDVHTFMEGIDPQLHKFLEETFQGMMREALPDVLRDEITKKLNLTEQQKKDVRKITEPPPI